MILDKQAIFSEDQAYSALASIDSTNVIDLGADHARVPSYTEKPAELFIQITSAFTGGTSMQVGLYHDSSEDMSSEALVFESAAIAEASLVAGYQYKLPALPAGLSRYLRLTYTNVGSHTAGAVTAGLVLDRQTNV